MMQSSSKIQERDSTIANFELRVDGHCDNVVEVSAKLITLSPPVELPPWEAGLFNRVEGEEIHRRIRLPQGASAQSECVVIERE